MQTEQIHSLLALEKEIQEVHQCRALETLHTLIHFFKHPQTQ
jgi:hypothetical protein